MCNVADTVTGGASFNQTVWCSRGAPSFFAITLKTHLFLHA